MVRFLGHVLVIFGYRYSFHQGSRRVYGGPLNHLRQVRGRGVGQGRGGTSGGGSYCSVDSFFLRCVSASLHFIVAGYMAPVPTAVVEGAVTFTYTGPGSFTPGTRLWVFGTVVSISLCNPPYIGTGF